MSPEAGTRLRDATRRIAAGVRRASRASHYWVRRGAVMSPEAKEAAA
ncbi:MAG: hypothetical protein K0R53_452 [Burkholderiales bacterium]|jgi:hypothetical protein|nr:hypothetical protein [Burkholderiales bacterium]